MRAARTLSRAAIAVTSTPSTPAAGLSRAAGAMRAAPSTPIRRVTASGYRRERLRSAGPAVGELRDPGGRRLAHRGEPELRAQLLPALEQHVTEEKFPDVLVRGPKFVDCRLVPLHPLVQLRALNVGHESRLGGNE